jgi:phage anti-repressor protein
MKERIFKAWRQRMDGIQGQEKGIMRGTRVNIVENKGKQLINARDLYKALGVGRDFSSWIKNRVKKYGFVEGEDYQLMTDKAGRCSGDEFGPGAPNLADQTTRDAGNYQPIVAKTGDYSAKGNPNFVSKEYFLTLGTAKEIAMVENNEKGREIRRYLIKVEEAWNSPEMTVKRAVPELLKGGRRLLEKYGAQISPARRAIDKIGKMDSWFLRNGRVDRPRIHKLFKHLEEVIHYFYEQDDSVYGLIISIGALFNCRNLPAEEIKERLELIYNSDLEEGWCGEAMIEAALGESVHTMLPKQEEARDEDV